jgi:LPXTG-motif cell wall-anchored protein
MRALSETGSCRSTWEANNVVRLIWTLTAAVILVLSSFGTANAFVPSVTTETVAGDPLAISLGDPAPRPVASTTAVSGVVFLPSTSTASTGAEGSVAVVGLGLIGAAGAFFVIRRRRSS